MKKLIFKISILIFCLFFTSLCDAQTKKRSLFKKGNKLFNDSIYEESEINYRKSLEQDHEFFKAKYNLANSVFKQERFDESEATRLFTQLMHTIELAHQHGVIHRDIKPKNVFQGPYEYRRPRSIHHHRWPDAAAPRPLPRTPQKN